MLKETNQINPPAERYINHIAEVSKEKKPLVAIQCLTYNHEPYLRDALEGFVMQKADFTFVAIVHDDASTDGTAAIIREYAEKYPDLILPIYEKENQYSKRDGSLNNIITTATLATGAKYIALCEGDDYWTDSLKLQKQVYFMEHHTDYSMCFHNVKIVTENENIDDKIYDHLEEKEYNSEMVLKKWTIPTCSAVLRSECFYNMPFHKGFRVGDNVLWLTCGRSGKIWCINKKMAVYRRVNSGWTLQSAYSRHASWISHYLALKEIFPEINNNIYDERLITDYGRATIYGLLGRKKGVMRIIINGFKQYRLKYIKRLSELCFNKLSRCKAL